MYSKIASKCEDSTAEVSPKPSKHHDEQWNVNISLNKKFILKFHNFIILTTLLLLFYPLSLSKSFGSTQNQNDKSSTPWKQINTEHFEIKFKPFDMFNGESIVKNAENFYRTVRDSITSEDINKIYVYIVGNDTEFSELRLMKVKPPDWVAGLAFPYDKFIILKSPSAIRGTIPQGAFLTTFKHELAHVLLHQAAGDYSDKIPRWFDEGFSVYQSDEWELGRYTTLAYVGLLNNYIPFSDLNLDFPSDEGEALKAYAQSFSFVSYMYDRFGKQSMRDLVSSIRKGDSFEDAVYSVFNVEFSTLEMDWRKTARTYYTWIPIITSTTTLWFIASLVVTLGYIKRRKRYKEALQRMEDEDLKELFH